MDKATYERTVRLWTTFQQREESPLASEDVLYDENLSKEIRAKRSELLLESDWTQLADVSSEVSAVWAPYRKALRDITDQPGYPRNVEWPVPPS